MASTVPIFHPWLRLCYRYRETADWRHLHLQTIVEFANFCKNGLRFQDENADRAYESGGPIQLRGL